MQLTKQQKILGAVVALGLGAVAADRLLLRPGSSGPTEATASSALSVPGASATIQSPLPRATSAGAGNEPDQALLAGHAELASRLDAFAEQRGLGAAPVGEAFAPTGDWAQKTAPVQEPQRPTEIAFEQTYRLEAVMATGGGRGIAVINGKTVRLGDRVSGYELIEVTHDRAVFRQADHQVVLMLSQDR